MQILLINNWFVIDFTEMMTWNAHEKIWTMNEKISTTVRVWFIYNQLVIFGNQTNDSRMNVFFYEFWSGTM